MWVGGPAGNGATITVPDGDAGIVASVTDASVAVARAVGDSHANDAGHIARTFDAGRDRPCRAGCAAPRLRSCRPPDESWR